MQVTQPRVSAIERGQLDSTELVDCSRALDDRAIAPRALDDRAIAGRVASATQEIGYQQLA